MVGHGIIPKRGVTFVARDPTSFKSVILMALSVLSRDGGRLGGRVVRPARIIYVALEHVRTSYADVARRAIRRYNPPDGSHLHFLTDFRLDDDDSIANLEFLADDVDADLIIIDSFRRSHAGDENSSQDAAESMRRRPA